MKHAHIIIIATLAVFVAGVVKITPKRSPPQGPPGVIPELDPKTRRAAHGWYTEEGWRLLKERFAARLALGQIDARDLSEMALFAFGALVRDVEVNVKVRGLIDVDLHMDELVRFFIELIELDIKRGRP